MSLKGHARQFVKRIGYVPFPGTLNAKLEEREFVESSQQFDSLDGIMIDGSTMWWGLRVDKVFSGNRQRHDTVPLHCLERTHHEALVDFSDQITKIYHQGASMAQLTFEQPCGGHHTFEHRDEIRRD